MNSVDVVVPSYNYAHYLPGCVASLFDQDGVNVRVLIIDDASSDDTPAVAAQLLSQYPGLQYYRHIENVGHIATYNEGLLGWATAPYVLLISADDLLAPGALKRAVDQMERHQGVGMVCGMALLFESGEDISRAPTARTDALHSELDTQIIPTEQLLLQCVRGNPIATPTVVVRTELQRAVGPYAPELPHSGDMEMWMRFAVNGKVAVTRFVQAYKRLHNNNMSKDYRALRDLRERFKAIEYALARDSATYTGYGLSRERVCQTMADEAYWEASRSLAAGDRAAALECLQFALGLWPPIARSAGWRKIQLELHLSPWLYRGLHAIAAHLERMLNRQRPATSTQPAPQPGTLQGWWPELPPRTRS